MPLNSTSETLRAVWCRGFLESKGWLTLRRLLLPIACDLLVGGPVCIHNELNVVHEQ